MTVPASARPLPEGLDAYLEVDGIEGSVARLGVRHVRAGSFVDAYPAGTHDREILVEGSPTPSSVREATARVLAADPRCRRVVLAVTADDLIAISWAEEAGYRYVVDVDIHDGQFTLLVTEPDWVLAQPHILDDIPLEE